MKAELRCQEVRIELSARLDGEIDPAMSKLVDEHLATCAACRAHEASLRSVKRMVGLQPAPPVPDLTSRILERVKEEGPAEKKPMQRVRRPKPVAPWRLRLRLGTVAAAIAALVVAGATLPWTTAPPDAALASEIVERVRAAAGTLTTYEARFSIVERGWHPDIPVRRMTADVWFEAPERFRLRVRDATGYPGAGWPENDVDLVADRSRWWIREPYSCPTPALPGCSIAPGVERRAIVHRQPFDGTSALPTDIVLPLQTLASSSGIRVLGEDTVAGRAADHVVLPYRQASPLVGSLQPGGSWRSYRPSDRVDVWLDRQTWFPLRFEVTGSSGRTLLSVAATSFSRPRSFPRSTFAVSPTGIVRDGGFEPGPGVGARYEPRDLGDLRPYRNGSTRNGSTASDRISTWARGMSWLKIAVHTGTRSAPLPSSEALRLRNGSTGFYEPAGVLTHRTIELVTRTSNVRIETNLPRSRLIEIAASIPARGIAVTRIAEPGNITIRRIGLSTASSKSYALVPSYLPAGYRHGSSVVTLSPAGEKLTMYYRRSETDLAAGITITQSPSLDSLPPTSEDLATVRIGKTIARWSPARSELEWIDEGVYRAVSVPSFDLGVAVRIADGLRPAR